MITRATCNCSMYVFTISELGTVITRATFNCSRYVFTISELGTVIARATLTVLGMSLQ